MKFSQNFLFKIRLNFFLIYTTIIKIFCGLVRRECSSFMVLNTNLFFRIDKETGLLFRNENLYENTNNLPVTFFHNEFLFERNYPAGIVKICCQKQQTKYNIYSIFLADLHFWKIRLGTFWCIIYLISRFHEYKSSLIQ